VLVTAAVSESASPKVVVSGVVFHITLEPATKFVPLTVSVNGVSPATADVGLIDAMLGPATVNVLAGEDAALEFCTVTFGDPADATWALVTAAVNEVVLP
jgi:hypothetical protein